MNRLTLVGAAALAAGSVPFAYAEPRSSDDATERDTLAVVDRAIPDEAGLLEALCAARCRIRRAADGFVAVNPTRGWRTTFGVRGTVTSAADGAWRWGLRLVEWGLDGHAAHVAAVECLRADGDTVSLDWSDSLTEWWVNGPFGLEHGFTVHAPPVGNPREGTLTMTLAVDGTLRPRVRPGGRDAAFADSSGGDVLQYSGLVAFDADGRDLVTWMEAADDRLSIRVDVADARYPVTIDPVVEMAYLKAVNTDPDDGFGQAVAVDGDTVVVGAYHESSAATGVNSGGQSDNSATRAGAAYVFVHGPFGWQPQAYLKASTTDAGDSFGGAVDIDGDTIVVGASGESSNATGVDGDESDDSRPGSGAAYVFERSGSTWTQTAYLKSLAPDVADVFGLAVAVSGDYVAVGATFEDSSGQGVDNGMETDNTSMNSGAVFTYRRSGAGWVVDSYFKAANSRSFDQFGRSVALDGDTMVVGASRQGSGVRTGAAYVFRRAGSTWVQEAFSRASNASSGDNFGWDVDVSGDVFVVGAPGESSATSGVSGVASNDNSLNDAGAAYAFRLIAGAWSQFAYIKASNPGLGDQFGYRVAVEGPVIAVGASGEASAGRGIDSGAGMNDDSDRSGAAYVFLEEGALWRQLAYVKSSNSDARDSFGRALDVSERTVVVGAPDEDSGWPSTPGSIPGDDLATDSGAAYVFALRPAGTTYCSPATANSSGESAVISAIGSVVASDNEFTLRCASLPPYVFGYLQTSMTQGFVMNPAGSFGNLCLGGAIGRFDGPTQIGQATKWGVIEFSPDLGVFPTPQGPVAVQAGETWNFQCWFRDSQGGVGGSNYSDAVEVTFF